MRQLLAILAAILAFLTWSAPAQAQDIPECHNPAYLGRFGVPGLAGSCELVAQDTIRWNGHHARIRLIRLSSSGASDRGELATGLSQVAAAASAGLSRLGRDAMIDDVTILLGDAISPVDAGGHRAEAGSIGAWAMPPIGGDCPVYLFKTTSGRDRGYGIDSMVHELFHCIQYRRWGGRMAGEYWLIEGSAEYFVDLSRPGRPSSDARDFDARIGGTGMAAMSYEAVPWFLWLGDRGGPPAVFAFIGAPQPIAAMIGPEQWREFGKAYFDRSIHMPGGAPMDSTPIMRSITINAPRRLEFASPAAYTLNGAHIEFARGKDFRLSWPPAIPEAFDLWRIEGADWADPPSEVRAGCSAKTYRAIWGGTGGSDSVTGSIGATPVPPGNCTCPAGVWEETPESTRAYFEQSALGGRKRFVGGTRTLTLNPDHTGSFRYDSIEIVTGEGSPMVLDQVQTGTANFTWKVVDGQLLTLLSPGSGRLTLTNTTTINGRVSHEVRQSAMQTIGHQFSCDGAGLHLTVPAHRPSYLPAGMGVSFSPNMDFRRSGR